jgi:hypothetical protein
MGLNPQSKKTRQKPQGVSAKTMVHLVSITLLFALVSTPVQKAMEVLDNSFRDQLQQVGHSYFIWAMFSCFVVGAGIVLEGPEVLYELWPTLFHLFTRASDRRRESFERKIKKFAFVGWLIICLGVFGEGIFELLQERSEGQLQTLNDTLLKDARLTATAARQSAIDSAAAAEEARRAAKTADGDAKDAEKRVGALSSQTSALDAQLNASEANRAALEKSIQPRRLLLFDTPFTSIDRLKPFHGLNFEVRYVPDAEAQRAAIEIRNVLVPLAKWNITNLLPDPTRNTPLYDGVAITYRGFEESDIGIPMSGNFEQRQRRMDRLRELSGTLSNTRRASEELVEFLKANGWSAREGFDLSPEKIPPGSIVITVGFKPNPYFDPQIIKQMNRAVEENRQKQLEEDRKMEQREKELRDRLLPN